MTDYDLLSEPGIPRVSSISASQALRASSSLSSTPYPFPAAPLPTGLDRLDNALRAAPVTAPDHAASPSRPGQGPSSGGIPRGSITEIYGPPGVGKTAVSLNIAATALAAGENEKVVWIDTGSPIPRLRLKQLLTSKLTLQSNDSIDESLNECMSRFQHIRAPTLPHLLSLISHPPANFPGEGTTLLIIDSISALFQSYFPNATELRSRLQAQAQGHGHGQETEHQQKQTTQWLLNRKWNVISDLANKMVKLATTTAGAAAATTNRPKMAIILLNQTHTKIKGQPRPTLYPAVGGVQAWENCVHTRIVLYRDWWSAGGSTTRTESSRVRYAEIMKRGGKIVSVRTDDNIFAFLIEDRGLRELHTTQQQQHPPSSIPRSTPIMRVRKRKVDEVADSEDDDVEDDGSEFADAIDDDFQWANTVETEVKDEENNS